MRTKRLAVLGGERAIPADFSFKRWPPITELDEQMVLASLRQPQHAWGPNCTALQEEFAAWNGNRHCAATNSGTAALHMGIAGCDVGAGDEVITTTVSWTSTATSILHHNAIPIFVDVEWETQHIDPARIEAAITPKTRALMPVHYWGVCCDMDPILAIARKHGLAVIEDACQAPGSLYKGRRAGTLGNCAAFSLNQNKNLCGGEGGFFVTDDEAIFLRGRALFSFGEMRAPEAKRDYHAYGLGWMYRTSDLPAAFARAQLTRVDAHTSWAQDNWHRLHRGLEGLPHLVRPYTSADRPTNGYAYVLRTDPAHVRRRGYPLATFRDALVEALKAEGVEITAARWLLPAHTVFQARNGYGNGSPWTDGHARPDVSYDLSQYPVGRDCVDSSIWIWVDMHRPPNREPEVDACAAAVRKVFEELETLDPEEVLARAAAAR